MIEKSQIPIPVSQTDTKWRILEHFFSVKFKYLYVKITKRQKPPGTILKKILKS